MLTIVNNENTEKVWHGVCTIADVPELGYFLTEGKQIGETNK